MRPRRKLGSWARAMVPLAMVLVWIGTELPVSGQDGSRRGPRLRPLLALEGVFTGGEEIDLRLPVAVAAGPGNEVAVADADGPRLWILRKTGAAWQPQAVLDLPGVPVALIRHGDAYLVSLRRSSTSSPGLVAYEGANHLLRRLPLPPDVVPGALASVPGEDRVLVYDLARSSVLRLGSDGTRIPFAAAGSAVVIEERVSGLAATPGGGFLAAIAERGEVRRFDASGALEASWSLPMADAGPPWPTGLVVEPGGDILVVDRHGHRLLVLATDGTVEGAGSRRGWEPGLLLFPADVSRLEDGRLVVADLGNGRIGVFRRVARDGS